MSGGGTPFPRLSVRLADRRSETGVDDDAFLARACEASHMPPLVALVSGGDIRSGRHSILATDPACILTATGDAVALRFAADAAAARMNPIDALDVLVASLDAPPADPGLAFDGGLAGFLSYELKNAVERLPQAARRDTALPDLWMMLPTTLRIHDRRRRVLHTLRFVVQRDSVALHALRVARVGRRGTRIDGEERTFTREAYCAAVRGVRDHIARGDVYQVNLSQRFRRPFPCDPFALWKRMFAMNPAAMYAYIDTGTEQVLSSSMERFVRVTAGHIAAEPIKGTRPRGVSPEEDMLLRNALLRSAKDDAELSMIVDLMRNDLSRVCKPGSVFVSDHKRIDAYRNVFHLSSVVQGTLRDGTRAGDVLRAGFPAGSITGCPKIRAMEIIDEREPVARGVYTGSIGYVGWHGSLDLSVAIRTAVAHDGVIDFSAGGGIVYDSDPEDEYEETLHKARAFFEALRAETEDADAGTV